MAPAIFGSAVYQINILILTRFASQMPGANSYLYYADRIFQLPLALFGISVATSALPSFSRLVAKKDQKGFAETFSFAIRAVLFIVLPAMAGLIALRLGIVQSLFQGGQFHWADTVETARALLYFSFGLVAVSGVRVAVAGFNAHQDTKTPVKVAVVSLLTNIFACWYLMKFMGSSGLALAVTLSSVVNFSLLLWILNQKFGPLGGRRMISAGLRISALALLMGILIGFLSQQIAWEEGGRSLVKVGALFGLILVGMAFYFAGAYILRFPEMREFLDRRKK
jgi:putative peptidoglycan lipid II flippase